MSKKPTTHVTHKSQEEKEFYERYARIKKNCSLPVFMKQCAAAEISRHPIKSDNKLYKDEIREIVLDILKERKDTWGAHP